MRSVILVMIAASLSTCGATCTKNTRTELADPPEVSKCMQPFAADAGDWPTDWDRDGFDYGLALAGGWQVDIDYRKAEHRCLDQLKAKGVIR